MLQKDQLDLKHFDPEFVREPVPGKDNIDHRWEVALLDGTVFQCWDTHGLHK